MVGASKGERFGRHENAFGFLRLLFAFLVIVSHGSELFDGNREREPLTQLFGTISFGELAVDGFFIISGYLVVGSYLKRPGIGAYLLRRAARIYPGFIVASIICLAVIAPLAGADPWRITTDWWPASTRLVLLQPPEFPAFAGQPQPELDGSLWTIAYEFRCYLLVLILGALGFFRRPWIIALFASVLLTVFELAPPNVLAAFNGQVLGGANHSCHFGGMFLMGALFFLLRERIRFTRRALLLAGSSLLACLFMTKLAEPAVATFGAYIIFASARQAGSTPISRINDEVDISYGVYLYAWPVTQLLVKYWPGMSPIVAELITFPIVILCGWASWKLVEQPMIAKAQQYERSNRIPSVLAGAIAK